MDQRWFQTVDRCSKTRNKAKDANLECGGSDAALDFAPIHGKFFSCLRRLSKAASLPPRSRKVLRSISQQRRKVKHESYIAVAQFGRARNTNPPRRVPAETTYQHFLHILGPVDDKALSPF
jgi:hypothetical protein